MASESVYRRSINNRRELSGTRKAVERAVSVYNVKHIKKIRRNSNSSEL